MEQEQPSGSTLRDTDAERRSEAARAMGQARSERKRQAAKQNGLLGGAYTMTPETRDKLRTAQAARRERERQARADVGIVESLPAPKRPVGRPKKTADTEPA